MADTTRDPWNILVVDDDEDIHTVTQLALKRQQWRGRSFAITRADSARQARQILGESPPSKFHVALVDVVMETDSAGLELCDYIRSKSPLSLRIILRTGQAGVAPEERVVEEFEIDHYLAKVDATADRIRALVVASIRSSMDVRMLLALREQLESFAGAMQGTQSVSELDQMLARALEVLEWKYRARASFYPNLDVADAQQGEGGDTAAHRSALRAAQKAGVPARTMHGASRFGLSTDGALLWFD
jgi:response regulator RpfG family c-di-GMP phosphodiesterase